MVIALVFSDFEYTNSALWVKKIDHPALRDCSHNWVAKSYGRAGKGGGAWAVDWGLISLNDREIVEIWVELSLRLICCLKNRMDRCLDTDGRNMPTYQIRHKDGGQAPGAEKQPPAHRGLRPGGNNLFCIRGSLAARSLWVEVGA